ncbi:hypothetical protein T265_01707 [Opisthorchis viverrini]|uniref:Uncharacterized protein n=1 Tax=Opisthorchis viverrini TaxID=6198 RepID=A0A074ZXW9_OPIVI|nr:hypothetical protein T265_01707 [Opisthorchis viverrini]KER32288.1 hypothetical protein T265_01707 [Opisthorchis viverrini]
MCILYKELNIHLLFEWVFQKSPGYSLTTMQVNAIKRHHKFRNRSHFSRDAKRIYEERETPTKQLQTIEQGSKTLICILFTKLDVHLLPERVYLNVDCYSNAS